MKAAAVIADKLSEAKTKEVIDGDSEDGYFLVTTGNSQEQIAQ